jgi:threonine-phosphate decarboxylase
MHGGDVDAVAREYGIAIADLLDFSASVNPLGPPASALTRLARESTNVASLARYPDPTYGELRRALAARLRVPPECLVIANGSAALFGAVVGATHPRTTLLAVPAFGEQVRALRMADCAVAQFSLSADHGFRLDPAAFCRALVTQRPDLCVLTNPHNPSGALTPALEMSRIARAAVENGAYLLIDEAFIDFAPEETSIGEAVRSDRVVLLRSLTKFYGMPALRVGYAVATPDTAWRITAQLPAWPVTTMAAAAASEALADEDYECRTRRAAAEEREYLCAQLAECGVEPYESAANFLLLRLPARGPDSTSLRTQLIRAHHVIVRDCRSFDGLEDGRFVRVGVRARADNERLIAAVRAALRGSVA